VIPQFEHSPDERSGWMILPPRSRVATRKRFEESAEKRPEPLDLDLAIARREDDLMVGGINVGQMDQVNGTFSYGVGIGPEHKGNGYAAEAGEYHDELVFGMTVEEFHELYPKLKPAL
jgi:RimJ/RimL family protein N-acetyltransferase